MSRSGRTFFSALALGLILLVACGEMPTTPLAGPTGSPSPTPTSTTAADCTPPEQEQPAGTQAVHVYFHCTTDDPFLPPAYELTRYIPEGTDPLSAAMAQQLGGPTPEEVEQGFYSPFSHATADNLISALIGETGRATVNFQDLTAELGSLTTSQKSVLGSELHSAVFQFEQIKSVIYQFEGSCDSFFYWLESTCHDIDRSFWMQHVEVIR